MSFVVRHSRSIARNTARIALGTIFLVFGLNYFLHFAPTPPLAGAPLAFIGALVASGYVMVLVKVVEIIAGALLLADRFVPLALAMLAPIIVSIAGFHIALERSGIVMALIVLALEVALAVAYRDVFAPMLRARGLPRLESNPLEQSRREAEREHGDSAYHRSSFDAVFKSAEAARHDPLERQRIG